MDSLHSAESLNSYFIEQVKDYAIFATDTNGIITVWNKGAERIKGYTEEEAVGQFYGMLHPDPYQHAGLPQQELKEALKNGSFEAEDWRKRKDGSLFWAKVTLTPIFDKDNQHVGFTKITGDLTKQKELQDQLAERTQQALEHKNNELLKTNLDLDNFIYTASHDLRSPINNIEALMAILKEELKETNCLTETTQEVVQRVINSINRFKNTIADLTEISKLQKNFAETSGEIINVQEVYQEIMADMGYPANHKTCFMQTDFQVHQIQFSKKNFRSILYNLISNAIKYQAPDRDCIIQVSTRLDKPYVVLRVKDNGLGIKAQNLDQIFTMFKRFHDHVEGTGIGLFMVKRLIENSGGKIRVKSEEGVGTEFNVYFMADM